MHCCSFPAHKRFTSSSPGKPMRVRRVSTVIRDDGVVLCAKPRVQLGAGAFGLVLVELTVAVVVIGATIGITFAFRRFVDRRSWAGMAILAPWRRGAGRSSLKRS
jgi:hypothetical protein